MRWLVGALMAAMLAPGLAGARLTDVAVNASGGFSSPPNSPAGFAGSAASVLTADATALTVRGAFNVNADVAPGAVREQTGVVIVTLSFAVVDETAPYKLTVDSRLAAELTRLADSGDCVASAVFSGVLGDTNRPPASGRLGFGPSSVLDDGGDDAARPYQASGSATFVGLPDAAPVLYELTFTASAAVRSAGCEVAVRGGLANGTTVDCAACEYPGSPPRELASDGLVVQVTLSPACGDGRVDAGAGETCDLGERNGSPAACCDASCRLRDAGAACPADDNACTDEVCDGVGAECLHAANTNACDDGLFCNGADTCDVGSCSQHAGSPCPGPDADADCRESCDESADRCDAPDAPNSPCAADDSACTDDRCVDGTCRAGISPCDACQSCAAAGQCAGPPCTPSPSPTPTATPPPPCAGDCSADREVTVSELVTLVGIALGSAEVGACPPGDGDGDGAVGIDELVAAVNALLGGCPPA